MRIILGLSALLAVATAADLNHVGHHNQQHQQQQHHQQHQQQHDNGGQNAVPSLFYQQPQIQIRNDPTVQTQQHQTFFQQQPVQILQQQQQQPMQVLQQQQQQEQQFQQQQQQQQQHMPIQLLQQNVQQMHQQQLPVNLEINAQHQSQQQQFEHDQLQQQQFEHDQLQQQQNQQQQLQQEEQQQNQVLMQEIVSTFQQNNGQDINNGMNNMFLIKQQPQFTSANAGAFFFNNNNDNENQVSVQENSKERLAVVQIGLSQVPQLHQGNNVIVSSNPTMNIESENNLIQSQGQNDQSFQTQIFQFDSNNQQQQQSPQRKYNLPQIVNGAQSQQNDLRIINEQQESSQEASFRFSQDNFLNKNNFQTAQILPAIIAPVQSQEEILPISQVNSFDTNKFQTPQILPAPIRPVLSDGIPQEFTRPAPEPVFIQTLIQTKPAQEPESETSFGLFLQDGIPQEFTRPAPEPVFTQTLIQTKPAQVPEIKIAAVLSLQDGISQEFTRPALEPPMFTQTLIQTKPAQEPKLEIITEQPKVLDRPAVEQMFKQNLIQTKPAQQPEFEISTVDFPENTVDFINESRERKTSLVQTLPAQIPQFERKSVVNFVNDRSKPATNVQQNFIHTFSRPTTRIDSTHCGEGKLADIHGNCVTPEVTRNIFLYAAPHRPRSMRTRIAAPKPKLEYNIVFVRNPMTKQDVDPIVIPPPQQKTLVYVLNKKSQFEKQGLLQVPTHPTLKPEVYFVDYGEGENLNLPGGVDLESALSQMAMEGKVINQLIDSSASHEVDFLEVNTEQYDDFSQTVDIRNLSFEEETTDVPTGYDYPSQN